MKVTPELVEKVAKLARVELSGEEKRRFSNEFEEILDLFSEVGKIGGGEIRGEVLKNVFRKDVVEKGLTEEEAFSNTMHKEDGFFKGPRIK